MNGRKRGRMAGKVLAFLVVAVAVFSALVWMLWNWLMPAIFGLPTISFWQALGLLALSWILFGRGFLGMGGRGFAHRRWRRHMRDMTPEQREQFRKVMRERCGWAPAPPEGESGPAASNP